MPECLRCGHCCHWIESDGTVSACRFLVKSHDRTVCRVYRIRYDGMIVGKTKTGEWVYCRNRKDTLFDYVGCPYNTNKPILRV